MFENLTHAVTHLYGIHERLCFINTIYNRAKINTRTLGTSSIVEGHRISFFPGEGRRISFLGFELKECITCQYTYYTSAYHILEHYSY